jgi:protein-tyrosine phosphatase
VVPFTVLHVCMGNICRSPMAERLLVLNVERRLAKVGVELPVDAVLASASAGTGGWHEGEEMNPSAARQVIALGGSVVGFAARKLRSDQIDSADLVLTATADQQDYVAALRPDAATRTFVLGEFGRLLSHVDLSTLPPTSATPQGVRARGIALVAAVEKVRAGAEPLPSDDLDDPWGRGDKTFTRIGAEIEDVIAEFTAALLPLP